MSGKLIVFEGGECSGKSTQSVLLLNYLKDRSIPVELVKNPGSTPIGKTVRDILLNDESLALIPREDLLLYSLGHSSLVRERIKPALESGTTVICDRYIDSTIAYQGYGSGLNIDIVNSLCDYSTDNLKPHLSILIDIPVSLMEERLGKKERDKMEVRGIEFHKRVLEGFRELAKEKDYLHRVDGQGSIEEVFYRVRELVERIVLG